MPRAHDDNWDLASSVGATATMVAAGRAMATKDPRGLINDPFAEPLVRAVGRGFLHQDDGRRTRSLSRSRTSSPDRMQAIDRRNGGAHEVLRRLLRSTPPPGGVRQVVILASGLDSRAYRLPWPDGDGGLRNRPATGNRVQDNALWPVSAPSPPPPGAPFRSTCVRDWPAALRGCRTATPTAPTAWLAEGLLIYLPPEAQDRLFDNITALSAHRAAQSPPNSCPGISRFRRRPGARRCPAPSATTAWTSTWRRWSTPASATTSSTTCGGKGWNVERCDANGAVRSITDLEVPAPENDDPLGEIIFISGRLAG